MYCIRANKIARYLCLNNRASPVLILWTTTQFYLELVDEPAEASRFCFTSSTSRLRKVSKIGLIAILQSASTCCNYPDWIGFLGVVESFASHEVGFVGYVDRVWLEALGWCNRCFLIAADGVKTSSMFSAYLQSSLSYNVSASVATKFNLIFRRIRFCLNVWSKNFSFSSVPTSESPQYLLQQEYTWILNLKRFWLFLRYRSEQNWRTRNSATINT